MNRPGVGPQSLRGIPSGFPGQQQQMPQTRALPSRLPPSGKMGGSGATWAFGGGVPMGSAALGSQRPRNGPMSSFAQTIGGSQPATPLDMSEFPSLSNNQSQPSQSTWATSSTRAMGHSSNLRLQPPTMLSSQRQLSAQQQSQQQQEDLFNSSSQLPIGPGSFRFGAQNAVGQSSQANSSDDFPPLDRNANGDIGQHRRTSVIQNVGFGPPSSSVGFGSVNQPQSNRGNGLLNALSTSNRMSAGNRVASPAAISGGMPATRSPVESTRHMLDSESSVFPSTSFMTNALRDEAAGSSSIAPGSAFKHDGMTQGQGASGPRLRASEAGEAGASATPGNIDENGHVVEDPLAHMKPIDKWGLKGFTYLMNNYPDYNAMVTGQDVSSFGLDLGSNELISTQIYSLLDNEPPRPDVARHKLPECYQVHNVAPLESKMNNFNDEALIFMFYSNPGDISQVMAAQELHNRNWRYHKKLKLWLTKDEMMVPQSLGNGTERGYYIFFDVKQWHRERREFTLVYDDLENLPAATRVALA